MEQTTRSVTPRRGRPRKFSGPSRPVTLTLPVETIDALTALDSDLSRAIVRIVQPELHRRPARAELATFGRRAVIIVNASRTLERRVGVDLVPLPDGRALISFEEQTTPDALELRIEDALEDPDLSRTDRETFEGILEILKTARRSGEVAVLRRNIIVLEGRTPSPAGRRRSRPERRTKQQKHQRSTE